MTTAINNTCNTQQHSSTASISNNIQSAPNQHTNRSVRKSHSDGNTTYRGQQNLSRKEWNRIKFQIPAVPTITGNKTNTPQQNNRIDRSIHNQLLHARQQRLQQIQVENNSSNDDGGATGSSLECIICTDAMNISTNDSLYTMSCCNTQLHLQCLYQALRYKKVQPKCIQCGFVVWDDSID